MITEMLDRRMGSDPLLCARRTRDTIRYQKEYGESLDAGTVSLFLCDDRRGGLMTGQREFIWARRDEIHGCYRDLLFLEIQYAVMHRQGMVDDYDEFCGIFFPDTPFGVLLDNVKEKAG